MTAGQKTKTNLGLVGQGFDRRHSLATTEAYLCNFWDNSYGGYFPSSKKSCAFEEVQMIPKKMKIKKYLQYLSI